MKQYKKLVSPYCFWLFVLTIVPMLLIAFYAFTAKGTEITTFRFTLDNFFRFIDPIFLSVLMRSFVLGILTTVICLLIGYPIAYMISKCQERTQTLLILLITIPTWINLLMRTYAWMSILSNNGLINHALQALGFAKMHMMYTDFSVVIGMVYNFLPFMILPIHTSLTNMDKSLTEASMDLGASRVQTFFKITFRLSLSGVLTGVTMVFLPAISAFVIPKMLGGGQYSLIGNFIEQQFITVGNWHFGSAVSLVLAVIVIALMALIYKAEKRTNMSNEDEEGGSRRNGKRKKIRKSTLH
ncbi:MAG: ABC transporter permease [Longibaculum muris]|uniref:Spermidine/putrescine transport system permease protein n=1 Tax=Longibaculum muris TaxID=1796628 RepID=A0A4R3Z6T2_9FIRM|nr:ABC transporter permease [Longibaculum muris]KXU41825.1 putative spermidine/putrescine ABC transporter, permease protein PotB [Candidatus Stoquefichus sp. KLE1796]MBS5369854.1 ABC transporter permease [Coprobacillus cateniformis]MCR1888118.1 ABC transporter permease [Longibaculum muris]MED9810645.1 ABC transporter permease [Longibaculum muris]TCW00981.1 spermidine/putrescine transport system permease protein [Longibaculum muris]